MAALLQRLTRPMSALLMVFAPLATGLAASTPVPAMAESTSAASTCNLHSPGGQIQHVIWLQFDNVHFSRDNPNVPSDLEQMPHLLDFIESNGTLLSNHHTPLIAHTAGDIVTTLTGVYPDRNGLALSNSYRYYKPDGSTGPASSFTYWTAPLFDFSLSNPLTATDTSFNLLTAEAKNAPAPWVPFTRAGCNVGGVGTANIELENTSIDVTTVFGAGSPEEQEVQNAANIPCGFDGHPPCTPAQQKAKNQPSADFVGIAVHCGKGQSACGAATGARPDLLPGEPGGYNNFQGLFGAKYTDPFISPNGPITDLDGNVIADETGNPGFPGFDGMVPANSLSYVASMQEHGIPVTFNYVSDAHEKHGAASGPYGPGEAGYVAQLKAYDDAFAKFFARLQRDGINQSNTLFVFTADEGDHLVAGPASPASCDGVTVPCTYSQIGEVSGNLTGLLATNQNITTPFAVHSDSAPNIYITGRPAQDDAVTRGFERGLANLLAVNPYSGKSENVANFVSDQVEMRLLHMVTADPARTPTITLFAKPDYFLFTGAPNCNSPCVTIGPGFAWNHGDVAPEINTTFLGLVGPGVSNRGVDNRVWTDHTDTRPTALAILGLADDYNSDGRVITEVVASNVARGLDRPGLTRMAHVYKQINGAVGDFGLESLIAGTAAVSSNTPGDAQFSQDEKQLAALTDERNRIAHQMSDLLNDIAFHRGDVDDDRAADLTARGEQLLGEMDELAANP
jgi:hypothetical protein